METKKQIRREILQIRDALTPKMRIRYSENIVRNILEMPEFIRAKQILCFASYGSEPMTQLLMTECFCQDKKVFCPAVSGEDMEFFEITNLSQLCDGYKGIPEPMPVEDTKYKPGKDDFMILPGAAFDIKGNRIGYGKGFYDRYLGKGFEGVTVAIAYEFQIVKTGRIPAEPTDQKVEYIVTQNQVMKVR